jgi:hypothetical protein
MRRLPVVLAAMVLGVGGVAVSGQPAECVGCPTFPCFGSCGHPDCVCVAPPGSTEGDCYAAEYLPFLRSQGWTILESP